MQIIYDDNISVLSEIVKQYAKYQKVMLVFDDLVDGKTLFNVSDEIKKMCVINKMHISSVTDEIFNGYKVVVFLVGADSFLHFKYFSADYMSIFVPMDNAVLPFLLDDAKLQTADNFLLIPKKTFDDAMYASLQFNNMINKMNSILSFDNRFEIENDCAISMPNMIDECLKYENKKFVDIDILQKQNLTYRHLKLVDLVLVDAFLVLLARLKNNTLMLKDIYKFFKDDNALIDKFYALMQDKQFLEILNLNNDNLTKELNLTKQAILKSIRQNEFDTADLERVIDAVRNYLSTSDGYLPYLYLYDVV